MEMNQLIHYEQNLAACYEAEYLLSLKVNDQGFSDFSYDDPSEVLQVSTISEYPQQPPCSGVTNTYNSVQDRYKYCMNVAEMHESQSPTNEESVQLTPANNQQSVCDARSQYACSTNTHSQFNTSVNHTMHPLALHTSVGSTPNDYHGESEPMVDDMDYDVDTEKLHTDGPSRKRACLRQSES